MNRWGDEALDSIFDRNAEYLSQKNLDRLRKAERTNIEIRSARDGSKVPVLRGGNRSRPIHSLILPEREADSTFAGASDRGVPGFVVAIGLGAGFHLRRFIEHVDVHSLLVIDPEPAVCKAILREIDLTKLLSDSKVLIHIAPEAEEIVVAIEGTYNPILFGDLRVVTNRALADIFPDAYRRVESIVRRSVDSTMVDGATQTRLGLRWMRNAIQNLPFAENQNRIAKPFESAIVTAAGPSLESGLESLRRNRGDRAIVATDTSLPALNAAGISPDYAVSIDAQIYSYHHYLAADDQKPIFVFGLSVPRCITKRVKKKMFIAGSHPFSRIVAEAFGLSRFGFGWGSVTAAAIEVAKIVGSERTEIIGADFGYPLGKPYARGTYLYSLFGTRCVRSNPLESEMADIVFRDPESRREQRNGEIVYIPRIMDHYRKIIEKLLLANSNTRGDSRANWSGGWIPFLNRFLNRLETLPALSHPLPKYANDLRSDERAAFSTLLPGAMRFLAETSDPVSAIDMSRRRTIELCVHALQDDS